MTHTTKFRYEGFTVGQRIRALDGRSGAMAIEGPITAVCRDGGPGRTYAHYVIAVDRDVYQGADVPTEHSRVGSVGYVPMETSLDYAGRVTLADQLDRPIASDRDDDEGEARYFERQQQAGEIHYQNNISHPDEE